jgi:hypothetical protein
MLRAALLIAFLAGGIFLAAAGNRLIYANDEGLYLDGALRIFHGQAPYRDFFAITGPGTFWLLAGLFRIFGVSLESARLLRALDLAAMTGMTYWMAARLGRRLTAVCAALLFASLAIGLPNGLVVNHRWEGSAFALAAVAVGLRLMERPAWTLAAAAGVLVILGAWCTPSLGLVAVAIGIWICVDPKLRHTVPGFAGGALLAALVPAAVLAAQGALVPMIQSMGWNSARYSLANRIAYGATADSLMGLLNATHGASRVAAALLVFATLLPAILPPAVALAFLLSLRHPRRPEIFLLLCGAALIGSSLPRWDLMHLLYVAPVFVVLAAVWVERHLRGLALPAVAAVALVPAVVMGASNLADGGWREMVATPVGKIRASPEDARHLRMCLTRMQPGDTLFVFPYQALFYFLTAAPNPTRYSFLQPGMMSRQDELTAADELKAHPPAWILYAEFPPRYYLRIWPSSNPADLRMPLIEEFIHDHYATVPDAANNGAEYRLLRWQRAPP